MRWITLLGVLLTASAVLAGPDDDVIDRLASNDAQVATHAVAALQQRFSDDSLRPDELVRIAMLPSMDGESEKLRSYVSRHSGHSVRELVRPSAGE